MILSLSIGSNIFQNTKFQQSSLSPLSGRLVLREFPLYLCRLVALVQAVHLAATRPLIGRRTLTPLVDINKAEMSGHTSLPDDGDDDNRGNDVLLNPEWFMKYYTLLFFYSEFTSHIVGKHCHCVPHFKHIFIPHDTPHNPNLKN